MASEGTPSRALAAGLCVLVLGCLAGTGFAAKQAGRQQSSQAKRDCTVLSLFDAPNPSVPLFCLEVRADPVGLDVDAVLKAVPYVLGSLRLTPLNSGDVIVGSEASTVDGVFSMIRTPVMQLMGSHGSVWMLSNNTFTASNGGRFVAELVQFDPVSVTIALLVVVFWIVAPYIANEAVFTVTVFFVGITVALGVVLWFVAQRLSSPLGATAAIIAGTLGVIWRELLPKAAVASVQGLVRAATGQEIDEATIQLAALVAVVLVLISIGLWFVFSTPATPERLGAFTSLIRMAVLTAAPLAGSSAPAMVMCAAVPLVLQGLGLVVSLFVVLDGFARWLAGAVVYTISCPCRTARNCCRCCRSDAPSAEASAFVRPEDEVFRARRPPAPADVFGAADDSEDDEDDHAAARGRGRSSSSSRLRRRKPVLQAFHAARAANPPVWRYFDAAHEQAELRELRRTARDNPHMLEHLSPEGRRAMREFVDSGKEPPFLPFEPAPTGRDSPAMSESSFEDEMERRTEGALREMHN
ncbi:hypothetical protein FNF31_04222 [Cafeteria roenbergensis]|uniref:TRP C-terminal domain-containing protein n=1 Tax=Cafeteria roenbergensis TaxID=33653 RepID=A0A5A8E5L5_CAFRO|nr:hypothetical protein FNF31_04222 [Cafeteria roenbergensis]KAA0172137.1 hypothetical protein FNF28_00140 [Cafeteria roenbergensis]